MLHEIVKNINSLRSELCYLEDNYRKKLMEEAEKIVGGEQDYYLQRTKSVDVWYESFKNQFIFQLYKETDLTSALKYMIHRYDPESIDLIDRTHEHCPYAIKKLLNDYIYKIVTAYFTKCNISYALFYYDNIYDNDLQINIGYKEPYIYLENLFQLLNDTEYCVNEKLKENWGYYFGSDYNDYNCYVHSGGNMYILLAGVLCFLYNTYNYEINPNLPILESIKYNLNIALYQDQTIRSGFWSEMGNLFNDTEFMILLNEILKSPSDIDMLFMTDDKEMVNHSDDEETHDNSYYLNCLSAYVLRDILKDGHNYDSGTKANRMKQCCSNLLPFRNCYEIDFWGNGRMFSTAINSADIFNINKNSLMSNYTGYRQTNSYISDISIYLNRIKQGFFPFTYNGNINPESGPVSFAYECLSDLENIDDLKSKYGECLDLVIGSINNPLYLSKYQHYNNGTYYSIDCMTDELNHILEKADNDDKSDKRKKRLLFLNKLNSQPYYYVYEFILKLCAESIHTTYPGNIDIEKKEIFEEHSDIKFNL